jgi:hypothetical protein
LNLVLLLLVFAVCLWWAELINAEVGVGVASGVEAITAKAKEAFTSTDRVSLISYVILLQVYRTSLSIKKQFIIESQN